MARSRQGLKNRVYIAYGTGNEGVIAIIDRKKLLTEFKNPLKPTVEELLAPQIGYLHMSPDQGAHTTFPIYQVPVPGFQGHQALRKRDLLLVTSEASRSDNCGQNYPSNQLTQGRPAPHLAWLLDITNETTPWPLSTFRIQETQGDFCGRGGRFGAHSSAESFYAPYYGRDRRPRLVQRGRAHLGFPRSVCHPRSRLFRPAGKSVGRADVRQRRNARGRRVRHGDSDEQVQEGGRDEQRGDRRPRADLLGRPPRRRASHSEAQRVRAADRLRAAVELEIAESAEGTGTKGDGESGLTRRNEGTEKLFSGPKRTPLLRCSV